MQQSMATVLTQEEESKEAISPESFPFPFPPYGIQEQFMRQLYLTLEEGKIGIFESPTGTGKSLSIICGALKWLTDYQQREKKRVEDILSGKYKHETNDSDGADWLADYERQKSLRDEAHRLKRAAERKAEREERIKRLKDKYGSSIFWQGRKKPSSSTALSTPCDGDGDGDGDREDEVVLDEYVSDDEQRAQHHWSSDEEEEDEQDSVLKIYYASRTHSQLTQFVHEVQKTCYKDSIQLVTLASRQSLCINGSVSRLKSLPLINDRCLQLQKNKAKSSQRIKDGPLKKKRLKTASSGGCPFYKGSHLENFRDLAMGHIMDIEQLASLGRELKACPYYGTRYAIPPAQLVVLPYHTLLHAPTREAVGVKVKDSVIIIDEAHDLMDTISSIHSSEITGAHIRKAVDQLSQYQERYRARLKAKNLMYINQLLYTLNTLSRFMQLPSAVTTGGKPHPPTTDDTVLLQLNDFLVQAKVDHVNMFKLLRYCEKSEISKKLNGFVERYLSVGEDSDGSVINSPLMLIESFLQVLTSEDKDGRVVVARKVVPGQSKLKYLQLNPAVYFSSVLEEARAVVIAGGTMQPVGEFKEQLFSAISSDRVTEFSCGHVIPKEQLLPIALSKGPSGVKFDFTFHNRDQPNLLDELGRTVLNMCTIIPGGVVCFFPLYEYEKKVFTYWTQTGLLDKINKKKQVFREPKLASQVESLLTQYSRCIEFNSQGHGVTGALMLCVVGGKLSEGINFSDNLGRCVIMIGLPYPNIKSPELVEKMEYINKTQSRAPDGKLPGQEMKLLERKREKERATIFREQQHSAKKGEITFRTKMAKRLYQTVFDNTPPAKNEFFLPGRMAYVFELNDEYAESDIPTTLLRSKADCPSVEVQTTLSTNDIVINKLTQILSYLRQGSHSSKKNKRKEKGKVAAVESEKQPAVGTDSIFADTGDYSAEVSLASAQPPKITSYFNKPLFEAEQSTADIHKSTSDFVKAVNAKYGSSSSATVEDKIAEGWSQAELGVDTTKKSKTARESSSKKGKDKNLGFGGFEVAGHYAECYPGGMEEMDATVNSDDETDYSKMDMGPHKGPVKRWDFDNEDDYSTYQSSREALPKAAFQYGVKMNDGRKTRRQAGVNKEKAKLDREWQQISQILHKRKSEKLDAVTKRLKSD